MDEICCHYRFSNLPKKKIAQSDNKSVEMGKLHLEPNNQSPPKGNNYENRT